MVKPGVRVSFLISLLIQSKPRPFKQYHKQGTEHIQKMTIDCDSYGICRSPEILEKQSL